MKPEIKTGIVKEWQIIYPPIRRNLRAVRTITSHSPISGPYTYEVKHPFLVALLALLAWVGFIGGTLLIWSIIRW